MSYGVIYVATNTVNDKRYVGQTRNKRPINRWTYGHLKTADTDKVHPLYAAIRKYGADAFTFDVVWHADSQASLDVSENSFIDLFDTMHSNGYNLRRGGAKGKLGESSIARLSSSMKDKWTDPVYRSKVTNTVEALWTDPEYRARQLDTRGSPEVRRRRSEVLKEALGTSEAKANMSAAQKVLRGAPEARARQSELMVARYQDEVARETMRVAVAESHRTPEFRAQQSATMIERYKDPEYRARQSAAAKAAWERRRNS